MATVGAIPGPAAGPAPITTSSPASSPPLHPITSPPHDVRGDTGHPDHTRVDAFAQQAASTGVRSRRRGEEEHVGEGG